STYSQADWTNSAYVYNTGTGRNLWLKSQNDLGLFAGGTSIASNLKVMIKSTGNVGIGTNLPTAKLDISGMGTGGVGVRIKDAQNVAGSYYYGFMFDGTDVRGTTQSNIFYVGGSVNANTTIADWASIRIDAPGVA
ncbi:hypothetical protein, partial [Acinetobacter baumannii]|uniref:hypothetical protein n=1 Tax=Acinetobacter baumannii TaxID=470 RepID=UPI001699FEA1